MEMSQLNSFFLKKIEKKKANQVLSGGWYQREEGGYKERV
jgi:hypothetical protein